ncbi:MAG: FixH family protein [Pseudomonadota bacterium]
MNESRQEFTGRHMLIVMVAFFGIIIAVNLIMATFASSSWTGLIVKNSYVASQDFNGHIEAARKQAQLGWRSEFAAAAEAVQVTFTTADGKALNGLSVAAKLYRPVAEADDRMVTFVEERTGVYAGKVNLGSGIWEADVRAQNAEGNEYRQIFRFMVGDEGR